jgi:hypothetical protein
MANGIYALQKIQFARNADSDSDDYVPATQIWRGNGQLEDTRNLYFVQENIGNLTGSNRTNTSLYGGKLALDAIEATYKQFPNLLEMSIKAATPVTDSGEVYTYTYPFPTTSVQTLKPYTIEGGDNSGAEALNFVHCMDWTLAGEGGKAWMMSGNLIGKQVIPQAFTGGASLPNVDGDTLNFSKTKFYIDADSDTWGSTLVSNTLLKATIKYNAKLVAKPTADGALTWSFIVAPQPDITVAVTFEHNASAVSAKVDWRAETPKLIRFLNQGTAFTSPGNTYSVRTAIFDFAGKWLKFNKIGNMNGNDILEGTFQVKSSEVQASAGQILIANNISTLG